MAEQTVYPITQSVQRVMTDGMKATYSYAAANFTPVAAATDVVTLSGAAGKIIKVNYVQITVDATGTSVFDFYLLKRSAANTGGTATNPAGIPHDSIDPAASGIISLYSANPSALGAGGLIRSDHYAVPAAATTGYPGMPWFEEFGKRNEKQPTLRSANELFAINFNGQTIPAGFLAHIAICWTEEPA